MKILMVNKFLYPNGGSETYVLRLGEELQRQGDEVQYFGMEDSRNVVGNRAQSYTSNMDFHSGKISKLLYPFKIIYSWEARRAIRRVLKDFGPDVVHLNNFNFQITPSVLYEIRKYEKRVGRQIRIIFTAHDYQLVCPNHLMRYFKTESNCSRCLNGRYENCVKGKCIHGSFVKSILGAVEGWTYRILKTYQKIDVVICPSMFMQKQMDQHPDLRSRTVFLRNFSAVADSRESEQVPKENYVIYFGRYAKEKGIETLLNVCEEIPEISFIFAGSGPYEKRLNDVANVKNLGLLAAEDIKTVVEKARFSVCPSECYENCPFSVMESIQYGTPVIGADIGGIPELIQEGITGSVFPSGNEKQLKTRIQELWEDENKLMKYRKNCSKSGFTSVAEYARLVKQIYAQ